MRSVCTRQARPARNGSHSRFRGVRLSGRFCIRVARPSAYAVNQSGTFCMRRARLVLVQATNRAQSNRPTWSKLVHGGERSDHPHPWGACPRRRVRVVAWSGNKTLTILGFIWPFDQGLANYNDLIFLLDKMNWSILY